MKTLQLTSKIIFAAMVCGVLALSVSGCSDNSDKKEKPVATKSKPTHNPNPFDHSGEAKVTENEKQKFEQVFAAQCVERETKNSDNKDEDKKRFERPCTCIATFLMKDLTAQEAEKFLDEHENPQSLRIKYENAAYHCLQENVPPKEPNFSHPAPAAAP
ncbi:MAG: hypothetical protein PHH59_04080 [Methylovulum sp.]|uniref:hypothetical protein n=1 Tax=Methylovulum sp. TaxID=1916980 RepID=UPI002611220F|nr:hypothetical protein [Methylovulum sp.]MDD2723187.1 hypothetical protein [Methylovulum sp.]MDD5123128.1 hypothetical protein [Methylovulum sp.]